MRIGILTSGRFHVCDLARELDALGHDVKFYSCVPKFVTRRFGLRDECNYCLLPWLAPLFLLMRRTQRTRFGTVIEKLFTCALDTLGAYVLGPCDVFIGMSGMCTKTALAARRKYNARIWIERGSRHILSQEKILAGLPGCRQVSSFAVRRELADYALADTIVIPALHVERSFLEHQAPPAVLFRNAYGVDLNMFPPTPAPNGIRPTIIMVGSWSLRKGCDVLLRAWRRLPGVRLIHVGSVSDLPLPNDSSFEHHDHVPPSQLSGFYGQSHVFALPSREEGMAVVQAQALASGLRLVCSDRAGGEDLREFTDSPQRISVVEADDVDQLAEALKVALAEAITEQGLRDGLGNSRARLGWPAYGKRYELELERRLMANAHSHLALAGIYSQQTFTGS
jgi:starch synthase